MHIFSISTTYGALEVRSQLAANTFLTRIVQSVRPNQSFTYLEVASAFRLPARYVSKMLSRLAKRRLLRARRMPRLDRFGVHRGFLNLYSLSDQGLGKARCSLGSSLPSGSAVGNEGSVLLGASRAKVEENLAIPCLVHGKGMKEEYAMLGIPFEMVLEYAPRAKARKTNFGPDGQRLLAYFFTGQFPNDSYRRMRKQ